MAFKKYIIIVTGIMLTLTGFSYPLDIYAQKKKTTNITTTKKTTVTAPKTNNSQIQSAPKTSAEAQRQQDAAKKEIRQTEEQIKANEAKVKKELAALGKLDGEISVTQSKINDLNIKLNTLTKQIKSLEASINKNEKELEKLREEYLKAIKKMRVTRKNKSDLAFIFSSGSFNQALRRMRYLKEFSEWKNRHSNEINSKIADLRHEKESLTQARDEQNNALALQKNANTMLQRQKSEHEVLVGNLKENQVALEAHLRKKQAEANELKGTISRLIAQEQSKREEEMRKRQEEQRRQQEEQRKLEEKRRIEEERKNEELKKQEEERKLAQQKESAKKKEEPLVADNKTIEKEPAQTKKEEPQKQQPKKEEPKKEQVAKENSSTDYANARKRAPRSKGGQASETANEVKVADTGFSSMKGRLPYPVTGSFIVTSRFGRQNLPDLPNVEFDNPGIDAEVDKGASAKAVYKGNVSGVYLLPGYNTVVIVNHDGYYTVYGNIASPSVKVGDIVSAGQSLGVLALNEDDNSHGSIHFEVWKNREKQDPLQWLK